LLNFGDGQFLKALEQVDEALEGIRSDK